MKIVAEALDDIEVIDAAATKPFISPIIQAWNRWTLYTIDIYLTWKLNNLVSTKFIELAGEINKKCR